MSGEAPIAPSTPPAPASRDAAPRAPLPAPAVAPPSVASADGAVQAAVDAPSAFPLSLQFDAETHRLMIESRDPVSGFIVFQVPPKTAIRAIANSNVSAPRGERVDRET